MQKDGIQTETFMLRSDGITLRVFVASPRGDSPPLPSVQIHHGGGGYEQVYEHMAVDLARSGFVGITMIHRGYPGSQGQMEYGKGEIIDIGRLTEEMAARADIDEKRMGIMGYSRGAHNALLAVERYDHFLCSGGIIFLPPKSEKGPGIEAVGPAAIFNRHSLRWFGMLFKKNSCSILSGNRCQSSHFSG